MSLKTRNPGAGRRQGFDFGTLLQAGSEIEVTLSSPIRQEPVDPAVILAARANVALATARVHTELFGIGGAR